METDETRAPDDAERDDDTENVEFEDPADEAAGDAGEEETHTGPLNPPDADDD
jgi:hypothetical protein